MIVVFEGCECSGKTTHAKKLADALPGFKYVKMTDQLSDQRMIVENLDIKENQVKLQSELFKLFQEFIKNYKGENVVLDRYTYSTLATCCILGIDITEGKSMYQCGLMVPDLVFHMKSSNDRGYVSYIKNPEFKQKLDNSFNTILNNDVTLKDRLHTINIDGKSIDEVHEEILGHFAHAMC